ncbi:hypothetical protein BGW38_008330 [Lunasporangiospora selenospora]|uniref:Uncharacterized protein n=1 Tax=Lunasporangiospora selenospora TaxID=979761 RepID=A0A9P6FLG5_9FUNG|nr:hypothetical protein BGW38_008330 [Lunasporangiospora selenospora]
MNAYGGRPIEGLGLDPALMEMSNKDEGQLHHQQQQQQIHGQGDSLPQHLSQSQHHRRSRHGSKGSRDEFGFYSMAHHDRIAEDEEEESSTMLMAAEILNKSLSINRSYSSIRSSFLLEPSASFATPELENEAGPKAGMPPRLGSPVPGIDNSTLSSGAGPGATIASGTTAVEAAIPGDRAPSSTGGNSGFGGNNGRIRLFAPGQGHRVQRSSGGGSGSGSGSSSTMSMGGGSNSHLLTRSTSGGGSNGPSANGHRRTGSSNAGSNSSSIAMSTPGYSGPMSNRGAGSSVGRGMIGHQIQASCEDLLLSPSDNEDDDDYDDDSTESEDEDYDTNPYLIQHAPVSVNQYPHHYPHHYQPQQQQQLPYSSGRYEGTKTRENSFEYRHVAGSGMHPTGRTSLDGMMGGAAGGVGTSGRFMGGYQSPVDSQPTSRPSSRPNSRAGSRPGSMPTSPSSKRLAHERGPGGLGRHGSIPPGAV